MVVFESFLATVLIYEVKLKAKYRLESEDEERGMKGLERMEKV